MNKKLKVYLDLKKKIIELKIKSHHVLKEEDLALKYKVSRTPVREALQLLEKDGYLQKIKKVGYVLKPLTKKDLEEIIDLRAILESHAAYLATINYDKKVIEKLKKINEKSIEFIKNREIEKFFKNNSSFHSLLYQASKNNRLISIINSLFDSFTRYRLMLLNISEMPEKSYHDHEAMIEAMESNDEKKVEKLVKQHIVEGGNKLIEAIEHSELGIIC
jgi:DNA-binding GntR family transcriptional regulator